MNIAITGEGIVSAIGNSRQEVLQSLVEEKTGIGEMKYLQSSHHELPVGEVKLSNDQMKEMLDIPADQLMSRTALLGMLAIQEALRNAGIAELTKKANATASLPVLTSGKPLRIVLVSGTTVGGMDITEQCFADIETRGDIEFLKHHDCGNSTKLMAEHFGIFADFTTISTACSSAANAIMLGARLLKAGEADLVVAGGTEALSKFHLNGFHSLMILDEQQCRPFDATRAGLNLGEGAAYVVLESEEMAQQLGHQPHAYLSGYGNACDAFHQTASSDDGEGAYLAMKEALEMAHLQPADIQYVNAHGTGTPNNDQSESVSLKRIFGEQMPWVSSTKSFTGHTTSASGSIETVICLLAMQHHFVPANLGWKHPMEAGIQPSLGIRDVDLQHVLCNSFGFGGNDSSLVISAHRPSDSGSGAHLLADDDARIVSDDDVRIVSDDDVRIVSNDDVRIVSNDDVQIVSDDDIQVVAKVEIDSEDVLADIRKYVKPLEARRMGKIMKSSLLSSLEALSQVGISCPDAIITGTAYGCLDYSERLLRQMQEEGEVMLKPTYFMQSTHNTIGSNIAIKTHCHGYNVTYTQEARSLEWALRDACLLLKSGKVNNVLVGCHDESTPLFNDLLLRSGQCQMPSIHSVAMVLTRKDSGLTGIGSVKDQLNQGE